MSCPRATSLIATVYRDALGRSWCYVSESWCYASEPVDGATLLSARLGPMPGSWDRNMWMGALHHWALEHGRELRDFEDVDLLFDGGTPIEVPPP